MAFPSPASLRRQVRCKVFEDDRISLPIISASRPSSALRLSWLQEAMGAKNKFPKARFGSSGVQSKYLCRAGAQIKISANNLNQAVI